MRGIPKRGSALEESVAAPEIKARGQAVMKNSLAGSWESPETQPTPLGTPHPRVVASVHRALQVGERHMEVCHPCCCGDSSPQRSGCQTQGLSAHGALSFPPQGLHPQKGWTWLPCSHFLCSPIVLGTRLLTLTGVATPWPAGWQMPSSQSVPISQGKYTHGHAVMSPSFQRLWRAYHIPSSGVHATLKLSCWESNQDEKCRKFLGRKVT